VEEFVVHRRCEGGTIQIRQRVVETEREAMRNAQRHQDAKQQLEDERARVRAIRQAQNDQIDERVQLRGDLADARAEVIRLGAELQSERNLRALAELQARSTRPPYQTANSIQGANGGPAGGEEPREREQISSEPVDETAARFRLLELD